MTNQETCTEMVSRKGESWLSPRRQCGKPAKGVSPKGDPVCGQHLAMYRRRTYLVAVAQAGTNDSDSNRRRAVRACDLLEAFGIKASVNYADRRTAQGQYTGLVTLDPAMILPYLGITEELTPIQESVTEL